MTADGVDALVIFGATADLAKLETFPALVGLVERGVLDVALIGVAKSGWGLDQFRDYAAACPPGRSTFFRRRPWPEQQQDRRTLTSAGLAPAR